jgi:hypothetical protein
MRFATPLFDLHLRDGLMLGLPWLFGSLYARKQLASLARRRAENQILCRRFRFRHETARTAR